MRSRIITKSSEVGEWGHRDFVPYLQSSVQTIIRAVAHDIKAAQVRRIARSYGIKEYFGAYHDSLMHDASIYYGATHDIMSDDARAMVG